MRPQFAFLDSGTGGIPYMLHLKEHFPDVRCVYLGDTAHFPYGEMKAQDVIECTQNVVDKIIATFNPEAIVIACNTMSVTALEALRIKFPDIPFVGTVPAIKLAASVSRNHRIGLLATRQSVENPYTDRLISSFASDCYVAKRGDPELIDFIEKKLFTATEEERLCAVAPAVEFFKSNGCDTIILGCTHFTHIAYDVEKAAGKDIRVVDSRDGVVKQAMKVLKEREEKLARNGNLQEKENACHAEDMTFYITGVRDSAAEKEYLTLSERLHIPYGGILI